MKIALRNRTTINDDLSELLRPYENKWVALSEDKKRILWSGDSLEEFARIRAALSEHVVLFKVLPADLSLAPLLA